MTIDDPDAIALRPTAIGGVRQENDFEVVWRGFPVGRIMKQVEGPHWWWACTVYGLPATANDRGQAINYKDCQVRFRLAWSRIRPTLTEETIRAATQHVQALSGMYRIPARPSRSPVRREFQKASGWCSREITRVDIAGWPGVRTSASASRSTRAFSVPIESERGL
jgi:hypothetical protein